MLRTTGPGTVNSGRNGFGLFVRQKASDVHTTVAGGSFFDTDFKKNQEDNMPELFWNGQTFGEAAFQPGTAWHLYRLAVQGSQYSLSIDGKPMVSYTISDYPSPASVGVISWYYGVQVKSFEVVAIGPASSTIPFDSVPRDANLTPGDLPLTGYYYSSLRHWYSLREVSRENDAIAREDHLNRASLDTPGRGVSYGVDYGAYSRDLEDIYSSITVFDTAQDAQASIPRKLAILKQTATQLPNARNIQDLTGLSVGDVSGGMRADASSQGVNARVIVVDFARGRYTLTLRLLVDPDPGWAPDAAKSVQLALDLARIVDSRLPRG
jgi:hypothetical protein